MKKLLLSFTLPLTILTFGVLTQWSYGIVIDGTDEFLFGFPFIYKCRGFHTSLSTQYFLLEMVLNFFSYLLFWFVMGSILKRKYTIRIPRKITFVFWVGFGLYLIGFIYSSWSLNDRYLVKRDFDVVILDKGLSVFGHHPDREKYADELSEWIENNK